MDDSRFYNDSFVFLYIASFLVDNAVTICSTEHVNSKATEDNTIREGRYSTVLTANIERKMDAKEGLRERRESI